MFAPNALTLIHEASGGIPRLINRLCDRALDAAHHHRSPLIDRTIVASIVDDVPQPAPRPPDSAPSADALFAPEGDEEVPEEIKAAFSTRVDAWLSEVDGSTAPVQAPAEPQSPLQEKEVTEPQAPVVVAPLSDSRRRERGPERYMQKLARKWARTALTAALAFAAVNAIGAAATYVPSRLERLEAGELPPVAPPRHRGMQPLAMPAPPPDETPMARAAAPLTPAVPAPSESYGVAVGAFSSVQRAEVLLAELVRAGLRAFRQPAFSGEKTLQQIYVGPFPTEEAAERALEAMQANGGFADARVMPLRRAPASPPPDQVRP
jgi:cell division septation protein DedD